MTDEKNLTKSKDNEQETIESDIEQEESICSGDRSNVTTDDEFYNELMSVPPEHEDHLIPDGCKNETDGIEQLTAGLNRRYNSCPVVFTGTLKDAIKESSNSKEIKERRPLLIYVNHDKSLYSNLFCKQLLCHEKVIEFLLNDYVLWVWDVTFESNGEKLNEIYKTAFQQWNVDPKIGTKSTEYYPLLVGILRHKNGDYVFKNLINGTNKRPTIDEFLARLMEYKDQFDDNEDNYEKEKLHQNQMNTLFRTPNYPHPSKYLTNHHFARSTSMYPNENPFSYARSYSHYDYPLNFQQLNLNRENDGDDEEEEEEDEDVEQTPTVERPSPRFPK